MAGPTDSPPRHDGFTVRSEWLNLAAIAAVFLVGGLLVSPWRNAPVIDDWVYAWSVEHLLKTGELRVSDYSAFYPIAQILWGALFAAVTGFSFGILRLSTATLAVCGCWAIYGMLRELGAGARLSLVAAVTVALWPVYFCLSFTFMTDVPFAALSAVALFFYVSGLVRNRPVRVWWGSLAAVLAFLVRPIGIVLPLATAAGVVPGNWKRDAGRVGTPLAAALLVMGFFWIALPRVFGRLPIAESRLDGINYLGLVPFETYAAWNLNLPIIAAFPFAPLLLGAMAVSRRRMLAAAGVAAALAIALRVGLGEVPSPLPNWQTWSLQDLATRGGLLAGELQPSAWSVRAMPAVTAAGMLAVASLVVGLALARQRLPPAARIVIVLAVLHVLLLNVLWSFNDRYYLVFAPTLAYLAAMPFVGERWPVRLSWIAGPILAVWAVMAVSGTRDMLITNDVVARLAAELEASGVKAADIDAGYTSNGWRLYAHPENLPAHADPHYDVPFVTSAAPTLYGIVNVPGPNDDVLRVERLPAAWWQVTDRVYVVRHRAP